MHRKALTYLNTNGFEDDTIIHRGIDSQNFFGFSILSNFFRELLTTPNDKTILGNPKKSHGLPKEKSASAETEFQGGLFLNYFGWGTEKHMAKMIGYMSIRLSDAKQVRRALLLK